MPRSKWSVLLFVCVSLSAIGFVVQRGLLYLRQAGMLVVEGV